MAKKISVSLSPDEMQYVLSILSDRADFCERMKNDYLNEIRMVDDVCADVARALLKQDIQRKE